MHPAPGCTGLSRAIGATHGLRPVLISKWYNTKEECIASNRPKIVEFDDDVKVIDIVEQRPKKTISVLIEVY